MGWLLLAACGGAGAQQQWSGPFAIAPESAPDMVLEAVGAGSAEGTVVSIGKPNGQANQKWVVIPRGKDLYVIRPSYSDTLVMSAARGGTQNGTLIVLERDTGQPWQRWTIKSSGGGGSVNLIPRHAPWQGLDDFGGGSTAGARQDIWTSNPTDQHLQWELKPLAGATVPANLPRPGVIHQFAFSESKIFPGTTRNVTVFIPAEYDGAKPACVYVRQDGYNPAEKGMLESLIAAKDMPVTIGVFVTPGDVPAPVNGTIGRFNRSFEYDGLGDRYARFITEEILPHVAQTYGIKLSASGNDRCIAGASSGGISAFNAAWERPEAFSRVYAVSGSFVAFRGGREFPTLVRKYEAKPIRAFLTTGTHDMENAAGDWYLLDQEMDKALTFSGYDYQFRVVEGPHVAGWNQYFMEAMRFLWKGWPEPVHAGASAPRVQDILLPGQGWESVADFRGARSPACNSRGEIYFVDRQKNRIMRIGLDGKLSVFVADAGHADGLCCGPKNEIYSVSRATGRIVCYDPESHGRTWATGIPGEYAVATPAGGLYVTGPAVAGAAGGSRIWYVKPGRKMVVDTGLKRATGLALRPDQWLLSVADGNSKWVYSFRVEEDGALHDKEPYFWLHVGDMDDETGAGSVCFNRENRMMVATRLGIQVCADYGAVQAILPVPDRAPVNGVCLGGPDRNTLFAFCGDRIWRRLVKVHAVGAFSPWMPANGTPL
jgi:enterochelin esterase-like enzyme/sugar lactone lactonase YvrE